jgi:cytochrome c biogenesis protein CcdA
LIKPFFQELQISTILFSLSLSLIDSLSTTQQIIIFVLLLTTVKPVKNATCYLAGLMGAYFACGLTGFIALDQVRVLIGRFFPSTKNFSDPQYYQSELLSGFAMVAIGIWYFRKKRYAQPGNVQNILIAKLRSMNGLFAFGFGVFISVTSFPFSIPYLVALGKYAALNLSFPAATGLIVVYNIGYALPMIVVLIVYLIARRGTVDLNDILHEKARILNVQLTTWALAGVGVFSMLDAGCYFTIGHALVRGRCF